MEVLIEIVLEIIFEIIGAIVEDGFYKLSDKYMANTKTKRITKFVLGTLILIGVIAITIYGLATKKGLRPANTPGLIDSDYRGEVIVALHNDSHDTQFISKGERIAQMVIVPYLTDSFELAEELDETARGEGGFGSTGTN